MDQNSVSAKLKLSFLKFLIQSSVIRKQDVHAFNDVDPENIEKIAQSAIALGLATELSVNSAIDIYNSLKHVNLIKYDPKAIDTNSHLPEHIARKHSSCVIAVDSNNYVVAMANPCDNDVNDKLSEVLDGYVQPVLADVYELERHMNSVYKHDTYAKTLLSKFKQELHSGGSDREGVDFVSSGDQASAVLLLDEILLEGYHLKASDIHIEYEANACRVRYRIDGVLRTQFETTTEIATVLIRRLQILANLDISHHLRSEDGRFTTKIDNKVVSMRLSIMPLDSGQSAVIRFLGDVSYYEDLSSVVGDAKVANMMRDYLQRSYGMLLIVGPTGSGKTTTQYSALMSMDREAKKVISIEDPVEAYLPGVNQIPVNPDIGMDFADVLRSVLRQDPDVIMIGEIRDTNTATMSVRAAITGHMVLATIHTYDVASAISRLFNLGVNPHIMAAALRLVASQRLLRRLCDYCKVKHTVNAADVALLSSQPELRKKLVGQVFHQPKGCMQCDMTGYVGRLAVFEISQLDSELIEFLDKGDLAGFNKEIKRRMIGNDLFSNALLKVEAGETSLPEALRIIHE
ncbi:MAG: type II/IV secretion system protein [Legionellales bacterium]|jgi:MSHA biogenesis protein MshE|nr:type II/IV secretion system protein [Legionellales bacterium]